MANKPENAFIPQQPIFMVSMKTVASLAVETEDEDGIPNNHFIPSINFYVVASSYAMAEERAQKRLKDGKYYINQIQLMDRSDFVTE